MIVSDALWPLLASHRGMFIHLGGFESTHIFNSGQDVLGTTRHIELWKEDLTMLLEAGIKSLRYSIPWHRIEPQPGAFDWTWIDQPLRFMEENGMTPIVDPLHHTSFPNWLKNGFLHADFPSLYERYLCQISTRYPFLSRYTVFNEPLPTTLFCSATGMWYPHLASDQTFVAMALQVVRAICGGCKVLKERNSGIEFVHVETAEHHQARDTRSEQWVTFANSRRFLMTDLTLGRVRRDHQLYDFLIANGATDADLEWFREHSGFIDVLGLDYYVHSEMEWEWSLEKGRADIAPVSTASRGFASIAKDYIARYRLPIMLSETNARGSVAERLGWLRYMESQCEELVSAGHDFRGFCWYPSIDTTDWWNCCTKATGITDPQGIWSLDPVLLTRIETELSLTYGSLARGEISSMHIAIPEQHG